MDDGNASTSNEQEKPNKNDEQDNSNPFETEIDRVETDKAEETKNRFAKLKHRFLNSAGVSEKLMTYQRRLRLSHIQGRGFS